MRLENVFFVRGVGLLNLELVLGKSLMGGKSGRSNCFEPKQYCWGRGGGFDTLEKYVGGMLFICYYDSDEMMLNVFEGGYNVIRYENVEKKKLVLR